MRRCCCSARTWEGHQAGVCRAATASRTRGVACRLAKSHLGHCMPYCNCWASMNANAFYHPKPMNNGAFDQPILCRVSMHMVSASKRRHSSLHLLAGPKAVWHSMVQAWDPSLMIGQQVCSASQLLHRRHDNKRIQHTTIACVQYGFSRIERR